MRPVTPLIAALAIAVSACTSQGAPHSSPAAQRTDTTVAAPGCLASRSNTRFSAIQKDRVATAAEVVIVDEAGHRKVLKALGMRGKIVPTAVTTSPAPPTTRSLLETLRRAVPVALVAGPTSQSARSWNERLSAGKYVTFTGAEVIRANYRTVCGSRISTGTLTSWTTATAGILDCQLSAPEDSVAKTVEHLC